MLGVASYAPTKQLYFDRTLLPKGPSSFQTIYCFCRRLYSSSKPVSFIPLVKPLSLSPSVSALLIPLALSFLIFSLALLSYSLSSRLFSCLALLWTLSTKDLTFLGMGRLQLNWKNPQPTLLRNHKVRCHQSKAIPTT